MSESKHHHCPYRGIVYERTGPLVSYTEAGPIYQSFLKWDCGVSGMLCDRCKEDRADARAGVGNRLLALEEYATAIDAKASSTEVDVQAMSAALADAQTRLAQAEVKVAALESRLPGPQTRTQDLGTFDAQTGQRVDEPTQHGEARTCETCAKLPECGGACPAWTPKEAKA